MSVAPIRILGRPSFNPFATNALYRAFASTAMSSGGGLGLVMPSDDTTGTLPGVSRDTIGSNVTLSTNDQVYEDHTVNGNISVTGKRITIRNCRMSKLTVTNVNAEDLLVEDCEIRPHSPSNTDDSGVKGHDYTLRRVKISGFIDGINVYNNNSLPDGYASGVVVEHCWVAGLAYWTASAGGVVHPSDTWSHNDGVQHQGGWGSSFVGCLFDATLERQFAHWMATDWSTEPYTPIALNSLPDGGPWHTLPDRGTGTEATGRYNADASSPAPKASSITNFLIGNNVGTSRGLTVSYNWFIGGDMAFNGGGFNRGSETNHLLTAVGNRFSRDQGDQQTGGDDTMTFAGFGTGWSGFITQSGNVYFDGAAINFRGD